MNDKTIAPLRFDGLIGALVAIVSCAAAGVAQAAVVDVLWYSYAHEASEYKATIGTIAANAGTYTLSVGNDWNLAYFGPSDPAPDFTAFDVLVIHTGEAFRTGRVAELVQLRIGVLYKIALRPLNGEAGSARSRSACDSCGSMRGLRSGFLDWVELSTCE